MAKTKTKTMEAATITSPRSQRDAADQLAAAIALSQQEACGVVLPQQHPSRPKRERRAATALTYPADQTHSSKTEMARDKKNVERYFERMQRKLAAEEDASAAPPVEVEPTPAEEPKAKKQARPSKRTEVEPTPAAPEEPKAKKQARPSKRTEVEPTPAAPEEPKAKKQARPSKRTSEVQKVAETPAEEVPEPVLFAEVVCCEVMTMAQKVKRIQRELEIDPTLQMIDAVHAAETMLHWDFTQLDAAPLRVRVDRLLAELVDPTAEL